jgi:2-polyprenyl-6-hydroxyphenyl methylase / 3-demethylubiquinone-9 3-methyltransferase
MNADELELQKFSALAHRWWDPHGELRPLHEINPLRLDYIDRRAGLSGKRVLDVGCGGGILSESMAVRGAQVTGIDLAEKPIQVAKLHLLETRNQVEYRLISPEDLAAEAPACYDVVTCMELLEHVPDPGATVSACAQLANPGGHVFFSTLNRNPKAYLQAVIAAEYVLGLLPRGTHEYERFIKPSELARFCRGAKLEVQEIIGMTYHPLRQVYSLTTNTEVNYIVYCQKTQ